MTTPTVRARRYQVGLRRAAAAGIALALVAAACGDDSGDAATDNAGGDTTSEEDLLGPEDVAEGEPVRVGFISDGASVSTDASYQFNATDAIVEYLNRHRGGIAGRPIEVVSCETGQNDPAKASDCANELVQTGVVVTVLPEATATETVHRIMSEAGTPIVVSSIASDEVTADPDGTFVLSDPFANHWSLPIGVAEENDLEKVTAVVIDVPPATELFTSDAAQAAYEEAGIEIELVRIPPGQADMAPQMTQVASGDPTEVHIVGAEAFCIAALTGLQGAGFDGPISVLNICNTDATREALGDYLEGASIASGTPIGDDSDPGYQQWQAIYDTYGSGIDEEDMFNAMSTYLAWLGMYDALGDFSGEVTPQAITDAIASMPNSELAGGGGLIYRCGGNARPETPALCTRGTLVSELDADGNPTLPWTPANNGEVPD